MKFQFDPKRYVRVYGPWVAFLAAPLLVNALVFRVALLPERSKVFAWKEARSLSEVKPEFQALLTESRQIRVALGKSALGRRDNQTVMQTIQQSAKRNGIQVSETKMQGQAAQENGTVPVELDASGTFAKLARWMSELESEEGFRLDSWMLREGKLNLKMTVFLEES